MTVVEIPGAGVRIRLANQPIAYSSYVPVFADEDGHLMVMWSVGKPSFLFDDNTWGSDAEQKWDDLHLPRGWERTSGDFVIVRVRNIVTEVKKRMGIWAGISVM